MYLNHHKERRWFFRYYLYNGQKNRLYQWYLIKSFLPQLNYAIISKTERWVEVILVFEMGIDSLKLRAWSLFKLGLSNDLKLRIWSSFTYIYIHIPWNILRGDRISIMNVVGWLIFGGRSPNLGPFRSGPCGIRSLWTVIYPIIYTWSTFDPKPGI